MTETPYASAKQLLLETPLYETLVGMTAPQIANLVNGNYKFDGFCPYCKRETTFEKSGTLVQGSISMTAFQKMVRYLEFELDCARQDSHKLYFYVLLQESTVQKVGQHPSFADIAIDESKIYSRLLDSADRSEFHKSLGLAAHGIGIGSFVYLRRIFERLIWKRFAEYKDTEGWSEEDFKKLRMKEKIEHLKNHLPDFLVKNAKLYSILSLGVHELTEKDCLAFFPVLRQSTIWILEQDKKKQEELAQQRQLEEAISKFNPKKEPSDKLGDMTLANLMKNKPDGTAS